MGVEFHDDPDIDAEEVLIRRINPTLHVVPDANLGVDRLSTKVFSSSSTAPYGMSVDVLGLMNTAGIDPAAFVKTPKFTASVQFTAKVARGVGLWVGYDPLKKEGSEPENPYHAEVWSQPDPKKQFSRGQQKALLHASDWFVEAPGVQIPRAKT